MYMLAPVRWIDKFDTYGQLRHVLHRSLVIATCLVLVYWIFLPKNLLAYISPVMVGYVYERAALSTFEQKVKGMSLMFGATMLGMITFYLCFPFRLIFLIYSMIFLMLLYTTIRRKFPQLQSVSSLIIMVSYINIFTNPPANFQVLYGIIFASSLSITTICICWCLLPSYSLQVWCVALTKFYLCLENQILFYKTKSQNPNYFEELPHILTMKMHQALIPQKFLRSSRKLYYLARQIEFALNNIQGADMNELFWHKVRRVICTLRLCVSKKMPHPGIKIDLKPQTKIQNLVENYLSKSVYRWNNICASLKN